MLISALSLCDSDSIRIGHDEEDPSARVMTGRKEGGGGVTISTSKTLSSSSPDLSVVDEDLYFALFKAQRSRFLTLSFIVYICTSKPES